MKGRKRKDSTNAIRMNGEDGGNEGKDRLENENIRVNSTCRVCTAEKGPSLDPTLKMARLSFIKLGAKSSQRITILGGIDVQSMY
jgi:hypothetical protein